MYGCVRRIDKVRERDNRMIEMINELQMEVRMTSVDGVASEYNNFVLRTFII